MSARRTRTLVLGFAGVFLAGVVAGAFATAGYVHHRMRAVHSGDPAALHGLGIEWLDAELDLSADQERAIEAILVDTHAAFFRFKSAHNDELRAIVLPALDRVDAALRPDQLERWRKLRDRIVDHVDATVDSREHGR